MNAKKIVKLGAEMAILVPHFLMLFTVINLHHVSWIKGGSFSVAAPVQD